MAALAKAAHSLATTVEEIDPRLEELGGRKTERRLGSRAHSPVSYTHLTLPTIYSV